MINNWYNELEKIKELRFFKYTSIFLMVFIFILSIFFIFNKGNEIKYPISGEIEQVDVEEYAIYIKINNEWYSFHKKVDFTLAKGDQIIIKEIKQSNNLKIFINDSIKFEYPSEKFLH